MKSIAKQRFSLMLLCVFQIITVITPITVLLALKHNEYFSTPEKTFSISFAGVIALTFIALQVMGKTPKNVHKMIKLAILTALLWALKPILNELCMLVSAVFLGELLGFICFSHAIRIQKLKISSFEMQKADIQLQKMSDGERELRGRV